MAHPAALHRPAFPVLSLLLDFFRKDIDLRLGMFDECVRLAREVLRDLEPHK
jgi:hypothetical protein